MCGEKDGGIGWDFFEEIDENCPFSLERLHDMLVVDNLVIHVDGWSKMLKRQLEALNGHVDASTKTAGGGKNYFHRTLRSVKARWISRYHSGMSAPSEAIPTLERTPRPGKSIVVQDLKCFGPGSSSVPMDIWNAKKYCKSLARRHYENFSITSLLVPAAIRQDFYNIYAYCRWSDDLADEIGNTTDSLLLLDWWRTELRACFLGNATHPVFVALNETISKHALSIDNFENLLDAFVQDQTVVRYASQLQVIEYCRGSANPVGRILLQLASVEDANALTLSDRICTGLQIANFCQDIREDAVNGRVYLPKDLWQRFQVTEPEILAGQSTGNLRYALKVWVDLARTCLVSGLPLVKITPRWLARDIQLFTRGGLTILNNIARSDYNVWDQPIQVSKKQKLSLLVRAILFPRSIHVTQLVCPQGSKSV